MVTINGVKFACERCIRGHRVSGCTHIDSPLRQVKRKGRPPAKSANVHKQRSRTNSTSMRRSSAFRSCEDLTQFREREMDFSLVTNLSPDRLQELRSNSDIEIRLPGGALLAPPSNKSLRPKSAVSFDNNKPLPSNLVSNSSHPPASLTPPDLVPPSPNSLVPSAARNSQHSHEQSNLSSLHAELHPELHPELHRIPSSDISQDISPRMNAAHRLLPEFLTLPPATYPDRRSTYSPLTQQARSDANVSFFRHIDNEIDNDEENDISANDEDDLLCSDRVRYKKHAMYSFLPSNDSSPVDPQAPSGFNVPMHRQPYTPTSQIDAGMKFELASDIAVEPNELVNSLLDYGPSKGKLYTPHETKIADADPFSSTQIKLSNLY